MKKMHVAVCGILVFAGFRSLGDDFTIEGNLNVTSNLTSQSFSSLGAAVGLLIVEDEAVMKGPLTVSGPIYGNGSGLTNLNVLASLPANSITSDKLATGAITATKLAANSVGATAIASSAVTSAKLAANSVGTNKMVDLEWNTWGDRRYLSVMGTSDLTLVTPGRFVAGLGVNLSSISATAYGASQQGQNKGALSIGSSAIGASQYGYNMGTQSIGSVSYGAMQRGCNTGQQTIGLAGQGSSQWGWNTGTQSIGTAARGASQNGWNAGTQVIGVSAHGAEQRGYVALNARATNNGSGSIQLLNLTNNQTAYITGKASIGLGACTVTNDQAIVAGDGLVSRGNGTVTARGFYGDGAGLTNLSVIATLATNSITTDKLAAGVVTATKLATGSVTDFSLASNAVTTVKLVDGAVTTAKLATGSVGTNKAIIAEWNAWGNARYMPAAGSPDLVLGGPGRIVGGQGVSLSNISMYAYGASQLGLNGGIQTIGVWAEGAAQIGENWGTQTINESAFGAVQRGYNDNVQTIGYWAIGGSQVGVNCGFQTIGMESFGASQNGYNVGTQTIGSNAYGAEQRGYVDYNASATNAGVGSIQLLNLIAPQTALITGHASIGLGACIVTNDQAIVAGDGLTSHGNGTVTARGFYGDGSGLTNLSLAATLAASSVNLGTNSMTAGSFSGDGSGLTGIESATTVTGSQSNTIETVDMMTDALGKMLTVRGFLTNNITSSQPYPIDIPANMPVMYAAAATGSNANDGLTWGTAKQSIQAAIDIIGTNGVIYVDAGVYTPITVLSNREVYVVSVFGPSVTSINGQGTNRCATLYRDFTDGYTLYTNAALIGFTLTNGIISAGYPDLPYDGDWAGAVEGGRLYNCVITGCGASRAVLGITLANRTYFENCLIYSNNINAYPSAYFMMNCVLVNSVVADNITSGPWAKTLAGGYVYNSIIKNNVAAGNPLYVDFYRSVSDRTGTGCVFHDGSLLNPGTPIVFTNGYWLADDSTYLSFGNTAYATTTTDLARGPRKLLEGDSCSIGCYEGPYRTAKRTYIDDPNMTAIDRLLQSYERGIDSVTKREAVTEARISTNDQQISSIANRVSGIESRTNAYETTVTRAATALQPASITNLVPYTGAARSVNLGTNSLTAQLFIGDGSGLTNLNSSMPAPGSITSDKLAVGAVTTEKLASGSVGTNNAVQSEWNAWARAQVPAQTQQVYVATAGTAGTVTGAQSNLIAAALQPADAQVFVTTSDSHYLSSLTNRYEFLSSSGGPMFGSINFQAYGTPNPNTGMNSPGWRLGPLPNGNFGFYSPGNSGTWILQAIPIGYSLTIASMTGVSTAVSDATNNLWIATTNAIATGTVNAVTTVTGAQSNTIASALQPSSITNLIPYTGSVRSVDLGTNSMTAKLFIGDGSGLTNLNSSMPAPGSITSDKLAVGAVTAANLGADSVGSSALAFNAVTTEKLADGAVTGGKIASGVINSEHLAEGSVTVEKLAISSNLNMNGNRVTNLALPANDGDALTKAYLRAVLSAIPPQGDLSMGSFTNGAPASFPLSF